MLAFMFLSILVVGVNSQVRLNLRQTRNTASDVRRFYAEFYDQLRVRGLMLSNNYPRDLFIVEVEIGHPAKKFNLAIGLDSSSMWILDHTHENISSTQQSYKANESSTSNIIEHNGFSLETPYKVNGNLYSDELQLHSDDNSTQSLIQRFGAVHTIQRFDGIPFRGADGIFGLGWKPHAESQSSIVQLMDHVGRRLFTLNLRGRHGSLLLGGLDRENCKEDIHFVPLNFNHISGLHTFKLNSFRAGLFEMSGENAFLDIGFPFIQMPGAAYQAVYEQSNPDYSFELNLLTVPCNRARLNNWVFGIGDRKYILKPEDFVIDIEIGNNTCAFALDYNFDAYNIQFVIGNPFIRTYCTSVDVENQSIGFSKSLD